MSSNTTIQTGSYKSLTSSWLSCTSTTDPISRKRSAIPSIANDIHTLLSRATDATTKITPLECPLVWAQEANAYDCVSIYLCLLPKF